MENRHLSFLFVDDEPAILALLKATISSTFKNSQIFTANNGKTAWEIIQSHKPNIIVSDISMPEMDGIQLLIKTRAKEELNDCYFIIMTAMEKENQSNLALEKGADDFIKKPLETTSFLARLRAATRFVKLQSQKREENELLMQLADELRNDVQDMIMLAVKFLEARIPASFDALKRISEAALWIAKHLEFVKQDEYDDIEIAGYLSEAGRIFLPDHLVKRPVLDVGIPTDPIMFQIPNSARSIVSSVGRFKNVANILFHVYENLDGSGFPERLMSWQIPIGSRIVRVALDYEEARIFSERSPREILNTMNNDQSKLYDHRVVVLFDQYIRSIRKEDYDPTELGITIAELAEGMKLTRDIITDRGLKLLPAGAELSAKMIERIISHNTADPILGNIFVKKNRLSQ